MAKIFSPINQLRFSLCLLPGAVAFTVMPEGIPAPARVMLSIAASLSTALVWAACHPQDPDAGKPHKRYGDDPN